MARRRTPRIHVRFETFNLMDKIEIWANRQGEKLVPWARKAIINQARTESARETIMDTANFSIFEMLALLRELAGPEASERAYEQASQYTREVKANAANELG